MSKRKRTEQDDIKENTDPNEPSAKRQRLENNEKKAERQFTCRIHGILTEKQIYGKNSKRRRCKECADNFNKQWLTNHPQQRVWKQFVARAKRKWQSTANNLQWKTQGQGIIKNLTSQTVEDIDWSTARLVWPQNAQELDLSKLRLELVTIRELA